MKNNNFKEALNFVIKWEGFISGNPPDPGGLTIWGISEKSHKVAVWMMYDLINEGKKEEAFKMASDIYYEVYWLKSGCEHMQPPMDLIVFDTAVNMGRSMAEKLWDESKGDWKKFLLDRLYTYSKFKQAKLYFRGWANRTLNLYHFIKEEKKC